MNKLAALLLVSALGLSSCQLENVPAEEPIEENTEGRPSVRVLTNPTVESTAPAPDRQRMIADLLYDGLQALDGDRLLTPVDDSAHALFMKVLAFEPDNEIALQGMQDIVLRYLALAEQSGRRGLFEEADLMLDRAKFVDATHPDIAKTWVTLQAEMNSGDLFFDLDNGDFSKRNDAAMERLNEIAQQAKQYDAFFLITAPNDDLARWMYMTMRSSVEDYRLRGNIELASRISIRLRLPDE